MNVGSQGCSIAPSVHVTGAMNIARLLEVIRTIFPAKCISSLEKNYALSTRVERSAEYHENVWITTDYSHISTYDICEYSEEILCSNSA